MRRLAWLILPMLVAAAPAPASQSADPPAAQTPSEEGIAAALELFADMDLEKQMLATVAQAVDVSLEGRLQRLQAEGREVPEKLVVRLRELLAEEGKLMVRSMMPGIRMELATIYARHFTAGELRELKLLQAHPVVKKSERLMPVMFGEMSRIGVKAAEARMPELQKKLEQLVAELASEEQVEDGPAT